MSSRVSTLLLALSFLATGLLATPKSANANITPRQGWLGPYPTASKCTCYSKEGKTRLELLCEGLYGLADYGRVEKGWNVVSHRPFQLLPLWASANKPPSPIVLHLRPQRRRKGISPIFRQKVRDPLRKGLQGRVRRLPRHAGTGEQPGAAARGPVPLLQGADYEWLCPLAGLLRDAQDCDESWVAALSWGWIGAMGAWQLDYLAFYQSTSSYPSVPSSSL